MIHSDCPLCHGKSIFEYHVDKVRSYVQCSRCSLIFVPPCYHLTPEQEKNVYDLHENSFEDLGYQRFLSRVAEPVSSRFPIHTKGLDFGCGPTPVLAQMLRMQGYQISTYDLFYDNNPAVLDEAYGFITATEVFEHLSNPKLILEKLLSQLDDSGSLFIMTKRVENQQKFSTWHYIRDPTHITFFSNESFQYIAEEYALNLELIKPDVAVLSKR
ncbi:class I SAM-dependent methyltransferase [Oleiphilus messinensis]|nr:class I SAM-dependent methyltransferase [Oleiphilus messinensis]